MRALMWLGMMALAPMAVGCGGSIAMGDDDAAISDAGHDAKADAFVDARPDTHADAADTGGEIYVDPLCPDAPPPPTRYACDPLGTPTGCRAGEGCFPWVQYPTIPCEYEVYGATCMTPGSGTQGTPCSGSCATGFICVVSGAGNVCTRMCKLGVIGACPEGLVCESTDVPGIGACI
jgi:hypothetical protein